MPLFKWKKKKPNNSSSAERCDERPCSYETPIIKDQPRIHRSAWKESFKKLMASAKPSTLQTVDSYNRTVLHIACAKGLEDFVVHLVTVCKADPNIADCNGCTPLHKLIEGRHRHLLPILLKSTDINVSLSDLNDATPLHYTSVFGETEMLKQLLACSNCPLDVKNKEGQTALHIASYNGFAGVVQALLEAGADPNIQDGEGRTSIMYASFKGQTEVVKILCHFNVDIELEDLIGDNVLSYAVNGGHQECVEVLEEYQRNLLRETSTSITTTDSDTLNNSEAPCNAKKEMSAKVAEEHSTDDQSQVGCALLDIQKRNDIDSTVSDAAKELGALTSANKYAPARDLQSSNIHTISTISTIVGTSYTGPSCKPSNTEPSSGPSYARPSSRPCYIGNVISSTPTRSAHEGKSNLNTIITSTSSSGSIQDPLAPSVKTPIHTDCAINTYNKTFGPDFRNESPAVELQPFVFPPISPTNTMVGTTYTGPSHTSNKISSIPTSPAYQVHSYLNTTPRSNSSGSKCDRLAGSSIYAGSAMTTFNQVSRINLLTENVVYKYKSPFTYTNVTSSAGKYMSQSSTISPISTPNTFVSTSYTGPSSKHSYTGPSSGPSNTGPSSGPCYTGNVISSTPTRSAHEGNSNLNTITKTSSSGSIQDQLAPSVKTPIHTDCAINTYNKTFGPDFRNESPSVELQPLVFPPISPTNAMVGTTYTGPSCIGNDVSSIPNTSAYQVHSYLNTTPLIKSSDSKCDRSSETETQMEPLDLHQEQDIKKLQNIINDKDQIIKENEVLQEHLRDQMRKIEVKVKEKFENKAVWNLFSALKVRVKTTETHIVQIARALRTCEIESFRRAHRVEFLNQTCKKLEDNVNRLEEYSSGLEKRCKEMEAKLESVSKRARILEVEKAQLAEQAEFSLQELKELKTLEVELQSQAEQLTQINQQKSHTMDVKTEHKLQYPQYTLSEESLYPIERKRTSSEALMYHDQTEIKELQKKVTDMEKDLQTFCDRYSAKFKTEAVEENEMKKEIRNLTEINASLESAMSEKQQEIAKLQDKLNGTISLRNSAIHVADELRSWWEFEIQSKAKLKEELKLMESILADSKAEVDTTIDINAKPLEKIASEVQKTSGAVRHDSSIEIN